MAQRIHDHDKRPSPEALLLAAQRESCGGLTILLGAAPGVGKTYAMLTSGRAEQREGVDVVATVPVACAQMDDVA